MPNKKVLIITYYWPPAGGAAVFRVLKFVKYLKKSGWEPLVLTVNEAESSQNDHSLAAQIPADLMVHKTSSFEPSKWIGKVSGGTSSNVPVGAAMQSSKKGLISKFITNVRLNFFIPDAKIGWIPFATQKGMKIIEEHNPDIIFSTSPPPSVHLIAKKLSDNSGIPWVADFRDPWTSIYYYDHNTQSEVARSKNQKLEREVLEKANAITVVNNGFFDNQLTEKHRPKFTKIANGFDAEDLPVSSSKSEQKFVIRYLGHFKNNQFPLALQKWLVLISSNQSLAQKVKLEFIGYIDPENKAKLSIPEIKVPIRYTDFVPRSEAMKLMAEADALLLCIGGNQSKKYGLSLKLFDYLMHQKPVLGFGPVDGDASKILMDTGVGKMFEYEDLEGVSKFMDLILDDAFELKPNGKIIQQFSVESLTKELVTVFESVIDND